MGIVVPNYYKDFKCKADKCQHSCCVGWEIDIDEETYGKYKDFGGKLGDKIRNNICESPAPHFILGEDERCPFLDKNGLCEIIINSSEENLCQICTDHPRFRNFLPFGEEIGLGLCCEAAADLILGHKGKFSIEKLEDNSFLKFRENIFSILQDDEWPIDERIENMLSLCGGDFPKEKLEKYKPIYKGLEKLDKNWDKYLDRIKEPKLDAKWDKFIENLLVYFVFRHFTLYFEGFDFSEISSFIALSVYIIEGIMEGTENLDYEMALEIARMYSCEIEYSEENIETLIDNL